MMALMDVCPNCGEPLEENASVCPYCGSDEETGWREDVDYYSVEIPEDEFPYDENPPDEPAQYNWEDWPGYILLVLALGSLLWAGFEAYSWGALLPLLFLGVCALFCRMGTRTQSHQLGES